MEAAAVAPARSRAMSRRGRAALDLALARRVDRKLHRYGESLNGVLSRIESHRGMIDELRASPFALEFTAQGRRFVADVKADPWGGYTAQVRGYDECFTEGDTVPELRANLVDVVELVVFDMGEPVAQ